MQLNHCVKMVNLTLLWMIGCMTHSVGLSQSQELPPKTKARIEKYGADADNITNECDKKVLEAGKKLVKKLNLQLKTLTRERRLAEATSVKELRDQLASCTKGAMFESMLERTQVPPSAGLHGEFAAFMEEAAQINSVAGKKLCKLRDDFLRDLDKLPGRESVSVKKFRDQVIDLVNPDSDGETADLPSDPQDAARVRARTQLEMKMRYEKRWKREVVVLLGELQTIMDHAIENEKLNEANAVQEVITMLTNKPDLDAVGGFLRSQRPRLPTEAADRLEKFVRWNEAEKSRNVEKHAEVDRAAVPQSLAELKEALRAGDSSAFDVQSKLRNYYSLKRERADWLNSFQPMHLAPQGPAAKIIEEFDQDTSRRQNEADQEDAAPRKALLKALADLAPDGTAAAELDRIQNLLTSDYAVGCRGVLLLEEPKELDAATKKRILAYRQEGLKRLRKLRQEHSAAKEATRNKLATIRNKLIDDEKFREVVAIDTAIVQRKHAFRPLWIPVALHKHLANDFSNANWMALLDVGEKGYLFEFAAMGLTENWVPRDQLALSPLDMKTTEWLFREHTIPVGFATQNAPTPIDSKVQLKVGMKVMGYHVFAWKEITIDELSPFGAVTYLDDAKSRVRVYPRSAIALRD